MTDYNQQLRAATPEQLREVVALLCKQATSELFWFRLRDFNERIRAILSSQVTEPEPADDTEIPVNSAWQETETGRVLVVDQASGIRVWAHGLVDGSRWEVTKTRDQWIAECVRLGGGAADVTDDAEALDQENEGDGVSNLESPPIPPALLAQWLEMLERDRREHPMGQHGRVDYGVSREQLAELIRGYREVQLAKETIAMLDGMIERGERAGAPSGVPCPPSVACPNAPKQPEPTDSGIIRAAEGKVLEPGEYEADDARAVTIHVPIRAQCGNSGVWGWWTGSKRGWVTAVRRVDPKPKETTCLGCGKPFATPDHDQRCSSCVESGTGPEPVKPQGASERAIVVGQTWRCPGFDVLVMGVEAGVVQYRRPGKWINSLRDTMFRGVYDWVSDPPATEGAEPQHTPICSTCDDTHQMWFGEEGEERKVPCTRCPSPCEKCVSRGGGGGRGAYCAKTPCNCECHEPADPGCSKHGHINCSACRESTRLARIIRERDTALREVAELKERLCELEQRLARVAARLDEAVLPAIKALKNQFQEQITANETLMAANQSLADKARALESQPLQPSERIAFDAVVRQLANRDADLSQARETIARLDVKLAATRCRCPVPHFNRLDMCMHCSKPKADPEPAPPAGGAT